MKEDDELNQVCVRLLSEGFLAPPEQIIQQRSDVVRESVRIEAVVKRVVTVLRIKADFDVVFRPVVPSQNLADLMAEVALNF